MPVVDELLILVESTYPGVGRYRSTCIWVWRPRERSLEVLPQDWFNNSSQYDDRSSIMRIGRNSAGRLVGDGRVDKPFRLDETGRQLECYLPESPFRQPAE